MLQLQTNCSYLLIKQINWAIGCDTSYLSPGTWWNFITLTISISTRSINTRSLNATDLWCTPWFSKQTISLHYRYYIRSIICIQSCWSPQTSWSIPRTSHSTHLCTLLQSIPIKSHLLSPIWKCQESLGKRILWHSPRNSLFAISFYYLSGRNAPYNPTNSNKLGNPNCHVRRWFYFMVYWLFYSPSCYESFHINQQSYCSLD
jgi:hypothetical protein